MSFDWTGKTYWLIGASEGLGRALAIELSRHGCNLILSARNKTRLSELEADLTIRPNILPCDVSDRDSIKSAAQHIEHIDGLIYLAAVYEPLSANNWNTDAVEMMCDVNFLGAVRVLGAALPKLERAGGGHQSCAEADDPDRSWHL